MAEIGHPLAPGEFDGFVGTTDLAVAEHYAPIAGVGVEELLERMARAFLAGIAAGIPLFPDAVLLLEHVVSSGLGVGVGSNSSRWRLDAVLGAAGVESLVDVSVSGDEVDRPKPAPDVYLAVAAGLGVDPQRSVVIEDSPTGIESARAAGFLVVGVRRGHFDAAALSDADLVVDALD
jgi:HAD superfamily hydrolase (TIGR01509 family)